jgi:biotin carboxyl carrier protein
VKVNDTWYDVEVGDLTGPTVRVQVNGQTYEVEVDRAGAPGTARPAVIPPPVAQPSAPPVMAAPAPAPVPATAAPPAPRPAAGALVLKAPMPGTIISVLAKVGDPVARGQDLCVLEAMKMQNSLKASQPGVVKAIHIAPGQKVGAGAVLIEFNPPA